MIIRSATVNSHVETFINYRAGDVKSLHIFIDVCARACRYQGTPHYLYGRVRYTGGTRGHKLVRVCPLVNAARKRTHTHNATK